MSVVYVCAVNLCELLTCLLQSSRDQLQLINTSCWKSSCFRLLRLSAICLRPSTTRRVQDHGERSESTTASVGGTGGGLVNLESLSCSRLPPRSSPCLSEMRRVVKKKLKKTTGVESSSNLLCISFRESCQSASLTCSTFPMVTAEHTELSWQTTWKPDSQGTVQSDVMVNRRKMGKLQHEEMMTH